MTDLKSMNGEGRQKNGLGGECNERKSAGQTGLSIRSGGGLVVNSLFMSKQGRSARGRMYFTPYGIFPLLIRSG